MPQTFTLGSFTRFIASPGSGGGCPRDMRARRIASNIAKLPELLQS
jgi:hypothetical protein